MCVTLVCSECCNEFRKDACMDKRWCACVSWTIRNAKCDDCYRKQEDKDHARTKQEEYKKEKSNATWYVKL
jgi:hypothetical protein